MDVNIHKARRDKLPPGIEGFIRIAGKLRRNFANFPVLYQQVELPVKAVDRATSILRERFSLQPVYPETRRGANATRINFFLVPTPAAGKVLIELVGNNS